jgi:hypothetical protein
MSFQHSQTIKAVRKARYCYWCGEMIEVGQPAVKAAGVSEGDFWSSTMHPECDEACIVWWKKIGRDADYGPEEHSMLRGSTLDKNP